MLEEGALAILALGTLGTASTTAELPARLNGLEPRRPLLPGFVRPRVTKLRFWRQVETQKTGSGAERRRESSLMPRRRLRGEGRRGGSGYSGSSPPTVQTFTFGGRGVEVGEGDDGQRPSGHRK